MTFFSRLVPALIGAALLAPAVARAEGLELSATFEPAEVEVGQVAHCKVRLKNTGAAAVEALELAEDRQVISFDVQLDAGRTFRYERITPNPELPRQDWPKTQVPAGGMLELDVPFVALTAGELKVTAQYARGAQGALSAPATSLRMKPAAGGLSETQVILQTTFGPIRLRLFPKDALGTCLHFARLATVGLNRRPHFYDGLSIHRVVPGFMIQMGDPAGDGTGGPGYTIPAEFAQAPIPASLRHLVGRLSMARAKHNDSAGSQFFICVGDSPGLDGLYTCFGEVERGLDVAFALSSVPTVVPENQQSAPEEQREASKPSDPLHILSVRIVAAAPPTHSQSGRGQTSQPARPPQVEAPGEPTPPPPGH